MEPITLIAGGLIALVLGNEIFSNDDDDKTVSQVNTDDDTQVDTDDDTPVTTDIEYDADNDLVQGTSGDDLIDVNKIIFDGRSITPSRVLGGDGNDEILLLPSDETEVQGEGGNDTIKVATGGDAIGDIYGGDGDDYLDVRGSDGRIIDGGAGNDLIEASPRGDADIFGGEGNDTVEYDGDVAGEFVGSDIDLGAGDDSLSADLGLDAVHLSKLQITTGSGADSIEIDVERDDDLMIATDSDDGSLSYYNSYIGRAGTLATVTDFNPAEDMLTVDPGTESSKFIEYASQAKGTLTYRSYDVTENADGSVVTLYYDALVGSETTQVELQIDLPGATGIPASAIKIIGV